MDENEQPTPVERETTIIQTGERSGGGGTIALVIVLLLVAVAAFAYFGGYLGRAADEVGVNVNVEAPDVTLPDINIDTDRDKGESAPANKSE